MKREPKTPAYGPECSLAPGGRADVSGVIPDVRDGLTRPERIVLHHLHCLQRERPGRYISTAELYGRVVEYVDMSQERMQLILQRLGEHRGGE